MPCSSARKSLATGRVRQTRCRRLPTDVGHNLARLSDSRRHWRRIECRALGLHPRAAIARQAVAGPDTDRARRHPRQRRNGCGHGHIPVMGGPHCGRESQAHQRVRSRAPRFLQSLHRIRVGAMADERSGQARTAQGRLQSRERAGRPSRRC